MAKKVITTIADASACVAKMRQGKACSMSEMKATALLLDQALKTARGKNRVLKENLAKAEKLVEGLVSRFSFVK